MHAHHHFVPLIIAIVTGLVTYLVLRRRLNTPSQRSVRWLRAIFVFQWLTVLHALGELVRHLDRRRHGSDASAQNVYWQPGDYTALVLQVLMLAFVLWTAIMMTRKSRRFPGLFRIELVLMVLQPIAMALILVGVAELRHLSPLLSIGYWVLAAFLAPIAGIAFVYSLRSDDFRQAFVR